MGIQIRMAKVDDAVGISELLRELGLFPYIEKETPQITRERVARHLAMCLDDDSHSVFVAHTTAGQIVGYGAIHWLPYLMLPSPEGYVSELFIQESYRDQSIGSRLLEVMKNEAQQRSCSRLMLLNFRKRASYQRQFYTKQGWEEREEMANFVYLFPSR